MSLEIVEAQLQIHLLQLLDHIHANSLVTILERNVEVEGKSFLIHDSHLIGQLLPIRLEAVLE